MRSFLVTVCGPAFVALTLLAGCEDAPKRAPVAPVSGRVTFQGEPVAGAHVTFDSQQFNAQARTDEDGAYRVETAYGDGLRLGSYKVTISPPPPESNPDTAEPPPREERPDIPERYRKFATTDLTAEVTEGENRFDFAMQP